jgi:hypothetical protein
MAEKAIELLISAKNEVSAELLEAEKSFDKFQKTLESETQSLKRYQIAVEEGEEALYAFDLQTKGLDETTAKLLARQRQAIKEMEQLKREASKPIPAPAIAEPPSAGKATKSATDFLGKIGALTGSSEISNFASQLGGLAKETEKFAAAGQKGGASAFAFKAGLAAAVGAIAFSAGKFLGDMIFQTEKWTQALETAKESGRRLEQQAEKMRDLRFADTTADIELIRNPEEKKKAYEELIKELKVNIQGVGSQVRSSQKAVDEWNAAWLITGNRKGFAEQAKMQLDNDQARLDKLKEQEKQLTRLLTVEKERADKQAENARLDASEKYVGSLQKQLELLQATEAERNKVIAMQSGAVGEEVDIAAGLLDQIEAEQKLAEERKKIADEAIQQQKRIEELKNSELQKLEDERVALEKGKEAAHAFRLEKQGLAKADAERIAMMQAELEKERERKTQREQAEKSFAQASNQSLQIQSSRFLTRGPTEDKTTKLIDLSKSQLKINEQAAKALEDLVELTKKDTPVEPIKLVKVGGG